MEAAKALEKGDIAIQGAFGAGAQLWGPRAFAGTVQSRFGLGRRVEAAGEAGFAVFTPGESEWNADIAPAIYALRTGFKYEVASWFAIQAGFGGGGSGAGGFISPDGGVIFSYQGRRVVPFLSLGTSYNVPVRENDIVFTNVDSEVLALRADDTVGFSAGLGFRIPIDDFDYDGPRPAVMFGYRVVGAVHDEPDHRNSSGGQRVDTYQLFTFGIEFVIRR